MLQDVHLFRARSPKHPLGRRVDSDDEVARAAAAVHADAFIDRLPDGYDAPVAERGATLSVGQKQLLSFARALAFDPPVLVLDEATSSVDTETEIAHPRRAEVLMRGRTTIAIAHRLSTIQDMDQILVLHKGVLRESGTHQELLARRGIYFKLYRASVSKRVRLGRLGALSGPVSLARSRSVRIRTSRRERHTELRLLFCFVRRSVAVGGPVAGRNLFLERRAGAACGGSEPRLRVGGRGNR